jgi:hypothetical protein
MAKTTGVKGQLGYSGLRRQGQYVYEEFLPELRWPRAGKIYQEMSNNDAVIGAVLYLAEMLIRGTGWSVKPASTSTKDTEAASFLTSCMGDMETSWENTISEVISMITYGFSFHEVIYKVRRGKDSNPSFNSKYSDGRIGWRKMPIRAQRSMDGWVFNEDTLEAIAFIQRVDPTGEVIQIPLSRGLLFRTTTINNNPEGRSLLRNAYRSWFFKKHFEEIEGIGIERDLAGFPILQAPEDIDLWNTDDTTMVELRKNAEALVASVRRDSEEGVLLPYGWTFELLSSTSARQINISETIDRYDNRIATTMLSDIILIGAKSGSFALADTKKSMLAAALQAQLANIADVFNNTAVPNLFNFNSFTDLTELPKIVPDQIQTPTLNEVAVMLRAMGLKIGGDMEFNNFLRRLLNAPQLDQETFEDVYEPQKVERRVDSNPANSVVETVGTKDSERMENDNANRDGASRSFESTSSPYVRGQ